MRGCFAGSSIDLLEPPYISWSMSMFRKLRITNGESRARPKDLISKLRQVEVCEAAENDELDVLIEKQAQFGRRVIQKNK